MTDIEQLLQPLAGSDPCGADHEYDSRFLSIKELIESGSEENPTEWKKVKKLCVDLLSDGRSTELLVYLVASLVATEGYQGLRDGLHVLAKSMDEFWESIYPKLDESEPEDERYDYRLNAMAQLGEPVRKLGDPIAFLEHILRAPLSADNRKDAVVYWSVWEKEAGGGDIDPAQAASVLDGLARMGQDDREALHLLLKESVEHLEALGSFLIEKTGSAYNAPFDEFLLPVLKKICGHVASAGSSADEAVSSSGDDDVPAATESNKATSSAPVAAAEPGTINSTADVRKALDRICAYYRRAEPSSPVPYLLKRAEKLIGAEFIDIVKNLNSDAEHQFRNTLDLNENE